MDGPLAITHRFDTFGVFTTSCRSAARRAGTGHRGYDHSDASFRHVHTWGLMVISQNVAASALVT